MKCYQELVLPKSPSPICSMQTHQESVTILRDTCTFRLIPLSRYYIYSKYLPNKYLMNEDFTNPLTGGCFHESANNSHLQMQTDNMCNKIMIGVIHRNRWPYLTWICNLLIKTSVYIKNQYYEVQNGDKWDCRFHKGIKEQAIPLSWARKEKEVGKMMRAKWKRGPFDTALGFFSCKRQKTSSSQIYWLTWLAWDTAGLRAHTMSQI